MAAAAPGDTRSERGPNPSAQSAGDPESRPAPSADHPAEPQGRSGAAGSRGRQRQPRSAARDAAGEAAQVASAMAPTAKGSAIAASAAAPMTRLRPDVAANGVSDSQHPSDGAATDAAAAAAAARLTEVRRCPVPPARTRLRPRVLCHSDPSICRWLVR